LFRAGVKPAGSVPDIGEIGIKAVVIAAAWA
jgi:hypothetical protein